MSPSSSNIATEDIVRRLAELVETRYVLPEIAEQLVSLLLKNLETGIYAEAVTEKELAKLLTADLRSVNGDRHLGVYHNPERVKSILSSDKDERLQDAPESEDCGFEEVKMLEDGIGYLKLNEFADTKYGGDIAVESMQKLVGSKAVIFDLRENGGGSPKMVQLLITYLLGHEPVHLNNLYMRETDTTDQFWILPYVPGERLADAAVFIVTSNDTFSAAEEFCYDLQNLKRGVIIGETTGGGAHPGDEHVLSDALCTFIPHGRAINPISGTNWEGTGVTPDVKAPASEALDIAIKMAKEQLATG